MIHLGDVHQLFILEGLLQHGHGIVDVTHAAIQVDMDVNGGDIVECPVVTVFNDDAIGMYVDCVGLCSFF